ncbi:MAG: hypothetical protein ACK53K_03730 [Burkholderiales bacterium]
MMKTIGEPIVCFTFNLTADRLDEPILGQMLGVADTRHDPDLHPERRSDQMGQ